jgi:hypothetical protein
MSDRMATLIGHAGINTSPAWSDTTMNLRSILSSILVTSALAATSGCDFGNKQIGETEGESGESETADGESESESGSDELICAEFTDAASCNAQGNDEIVCKWATIERAVRTGDSCEVEEVGYCLQDELFGETAAGCGELEGCEGTSYLNPYFKITPEGVLLMDSCGGTSEPGFAACQTGEASADDPPECACACALAP